MKRFTSYFIYTLLLAAVACACSGCSDDLDIRRDYPYTVKTLPLPKSLKKGESVALEFSIVHEGKYDGTTYKFRYFQSYPKRIVIQSNGFYSYLTS